MKNIIITQLLHPGRRRAEILAEVPDELHGKAMLLNISCEKIDPEHMIIYAHVKGTSAEDELSEVGEIESKDNGPEQALERLIRRF